LSRTWSDRAPRIVLAAFCMGILAVAVFHTGHSVESMDVRTYAQMIRGVSEHGLPYWDNGPSDRFTELIVPWGAPAHGHIWGIYGPLYPYLAAPAFRLGGLAGVSRFTFAILAPLAVVTFFLASRFVRDEWYATLAAILSVVSTPITAKALEITPFPLTAVLGTLGLYLTVRVVESAAVDRRLALLCGVTWAAAGAAHALCFPMAIAAFAILAVAPARGLAIARLWPALLGFAGTTFPIAWLNHVRFDSWNPISYGPIAWTWLAHSEIRKMNLVDQLRYSALPALLLATTLAAALVTRRRKGGVLLVVIASLLVIAAAPPLREPFVRYAVVAWAYLVDLSFVDLGPQYTRAADGLGRTYAGWVVKSTLQCSPLIILAPLALRGAGVRRWPLLAMLLPCAALYASFIMRANLAYPDALGFPWVYIRYTFPALPALLVASTVVAERVELKSDLRFVLVMAILPGALLLATRDDTLLAKRLLVLVVPLFLAAAALVAASRAKRGAEPLRFARRIVALTAGLGIAIALGHDLRANVDVKRADDAIVDQLAAIIPQRFALVGVVGQFDVLLSTAATHDVQYGDADVLVDHSFLHLRPLLDYWRAEGRPIYVFSLEPPRSPWADVSIAPVPAMPRLYLLGFQP
jgi:hypothetical protein